MGFLEGFEILLVVLALISQMAMVRYMAIRSGERPGYAVIFFFNLYRIFEYAECTKSETGRTGTWFWLFSLSLALLVISLLFDVVLI